MIEQYIKKERLAQGMQLRDMCRKIGIDASNYSKFERGKIRSIDLLEKVVEHIFQVMYTDDHKLWYMAIAASRQKPHVVYDNIIRDCLYQIEANRASFLHKQRKQWVARAVLSKEKASEMIKLTGLSTPTPPPPPPTPRVITEREPIIK
jgi:transcriptional regulator with XRE-family HTH domain